jgi:NAD-dependent dihydropyrimidine dehydrogenase PreA subunit
VRDPNPGVMADCSGEEPEDVAEAGSRSPVHTVFDAWKDDAEAADRDEAVGGVQKAAAVRWSVTVECGRCSGRCSRWLG